MVRQHLVLVRVFLVRLVSRPVLSLHPAPSAGVSSCPALSSCRQGSAGIGWTHFPGSLRAQLWLQTCRSLLAAAGLHLRLPPHPLPFISLLFLLPGFLPPSAGRLTSSSPLSQGTGALWSPGHRFPTLWGAGLSSHHNTLVNSASNKWPTLLGSCGLRFLRQLSGLWIFSTGGCVLLRCYKSRGRVATAGNPSGKG